MSWIRVALISISGLVLGLLLTCTSANSKASQVWAEHLGALESLRGPNSTTEQEILEALCFFERVTGVEVDIEPTILGWLLSEEAEQNIDQLKQWYINHGDALTWNEKTGRAEIESAKESLLVVAYYAGGTESPRQVIEIFSNGHLQLLETNGETFCTQLSPQALQKLLGQSSRPEIRSDLKRLARYSSALGKQTYFEISLAPSQSPVRFAIRDATWPIFELLGFLDSILMNIYPEKYIEMTRDA